MTREEIKRERTAHNLRVMRLPIIDYHNAKQVEKRVGEYFDLCDEDGATATVAGLALAIGVSRVELYRWISGKVGQKPEVIAAVERGMSYINAELEDTIVNNGNVTGQIFLAKNNFEGYTDTREVVNRVKLPELTEQQLIEQAKKLPGFIEGEYKIIE